MSDKNYKSTQGGLTARSRRNYMPLVLLALAAVMGVLAWRIATEPPVPTTRPGKTTLAEEVRNRAKALYAMDQPVAWQQGRDLMLAYLKTTPGDVDMRMLLARTYIKLNSPQEAEDMVQKVMRLSPQMADAWWLMGDLVRRRGADTYMSFYITAADQPTAGPEIWGKIAQEFLRQENITDARKYLKKAVDKGAASNPMVQAGTGQLAFIDGDFAKAAGDLASATVSQTGDELLWYMLATAQEKINLADDAIASLQRGVQVCPQHGRLALELAQLQVDRKQVEPAAAAYAMAAQYPNQRAAGSVGAARCYLQLGKLALAMKYADQAVKLMPQDPGVADLARQIEDQRFSRQAPATRSSTAP